MSARMAPWAWYWKEPEDETFRDERPTREAVIAAATVELMPGDPFQIIEARMSTAAKYEGSDYIPFLRRRNGEHLTIEGTIQ